MSVSNNACISYGHDYGEDIPFDIPDDLEDFDWEHAIARIYNCRPDPFHEVPNFVNHLGEEEFNQWKRDHYPDFDKNWDIANNEKQAALDKCPVTLKLHCYYDYPMYILALKGTTTVASRGYPVPFPMHTPNDLLLEQIAKEWVHQHLNIDFNPQWLLYSMNG